MKKTAHYRRSIWFSDSPRTLANVLIECFQSLPDNEIPVFSHTDEFDCVIARRNLASEPLFLQFVTYEKGAPAAVIPAATGVDSVDADRADPPDGKEYIQSQLFCVVRDDDVVWTSHNTALRDNSINALFSALIESRGGNETKFLLQAKLDEAAFERAFKDGIGEIDLGLGDFRPALERLISSEGIPGLSHLKSLVAKKPTDDQISAAADVMGRLVLRPGRRWNRPQVKSLLSSMASSILNNHEDEFVIETKGGLRLTKKKMSVHKQCDVQGDKQILNSIDCQNKLLGVLAQLDETKLLE